MQRVRVVGYGFKAFKLPKLRVWGSVKISPGFLYPFPTLIKQLHRIGGQLLFLDALIMAGIVKLIQIALDFPALLSRQLDCIGKYAVACLLHVETPCIVGRGVL